MADLLRQRDVRLIVGAVGVSSIGDFLLWVPLTLYVQRCWTVGMTVGSLVVARRLRPAALAAGGLVAVGVQGAGLGMPTAWLVVPFGCASWFAGRGVSRRL